MRVVQVGCGKMSQYLMRYVRERKGEMVGAFDVSDRVIGKDIGEIMGEGPTGVKVQPVEQMDSALKKLNADVAIVATHSPVAKLYSTFEILAANQVNAVSLSEELFYAWDSNPNMAKKIDALAKANKVTFTGSGYRDVSGGSLIMALAATAASIKTIHGVSRINADDYGYDTVLAGGVGLSMPEFEKAILEKSNVSGEEMARLIEAGTFEPSHMWPVSGWIASALGLHVRSITQKTEATTEPQEIYSKALQRTIKAGDATGTRTVVAMETEEGTDIKIEWVGKVLLPGEFDVNEWRIEGEPDMRFVMEKPATVEMTCACAVNRLPDVIAAEPGYITTEKMPSLRFHRTFD